MNIIKTIQNKLVIPKWLQRESLKLPDWAKVVETPNDRASITIEIDSRGAYREWLGLLEVEKPDQYWLECAYQCAKLDVQMALTGSDYDPRASQKPALLKFTRADEFALRRFPAGKGTMAATEGREARRHYQRIRGRLPF